MPSRELPGRGTKPTTFQSQGRRVITKPLSGNTGDLTNDFSSLFSELVIGAGDSETLTPVTPLTLQRQRHGEHGEDGPWHHHQVGRWGVLCLTRGLRRGAQRRADRLPAIFRQSHPALLRRPRGVVHAQSHCLQLPHWMHHGNLFLFCFFTSAIEIHWGCHVGGCPRSDKEQNQQLSWEDVRDKCEGQVWGTRDKWFGSSNCCWLRLIINLSQYAVFYNTSVSSIQHWWAWLSRTSICLSKIPFLCT